MKKIKKLIVIALAATMLLGATITVHAISSCPYCGEGFIYSTSTGYNCKKSDCNSPAFRYICAQHGPLVLCNEGHWQ